MMRRRQFATLLTSVGILGAAAPKLEAADLKCVQAEAALKQLGLRIEDFGSEGEVVGIAPPMDVDIIAAMDLLHRAPRDKDAIGLATWLANQDNVAPGSQKEFRQEWDVDEPVNPIVREFFTASHVIQLNIIKGDQTPWCAAFVNWCLYAVKRKGSRSAAAKSFRAPGAVPGAYSLEPKYGDIAVFQQLSNPDRGHVAFLVEEHGDSVTILGGNQKKTGTGGAITEDTRKMEQDGLQYLGSRSINDFTLLG